jgi:two-component system chemotaxis sensor kinase CheA
VDVEKYRNLFLKEAAEHIENLDSALTKIEHGEVSPEIIHSIFRDVHSIKGMSASMGYHEIKFLSHKLENFLDLVRKNEISFTDETIACFADSVDFLENLIREVELEQIHFSNPISIIEQIEKIISANDQKKNKSASPGPEPSSITPN